MQVGPKRLLWLGGLTGMDQKLLQKRVWQLGPGRRENEVIFMLLVLQDSIKNSIHACLDARGHREEDRMDDRRRKTESDKRYHP